MMTCLSIIGSLRVPSLSMLLLANEVGFVKCSISVRLRTLLLVLCSWVSAVSCGGGN